MQTGPMLPTKVLSGVSILTLYVYCSFLYFSVAVLWYVAVSAPGYTCRVPSCRGPLAQPMAHHLFYLRKPDLSLAVLLLSSRTYCWIRQRQTLFASFSLVVMALLISLSAPLPSCMFQIQSCWQKLALLFIYCLLGAPIDWLVLSLHTIAGLHVKCNLSFSKPSCFFFSDFHSFSSFASSTPFVPHLERSNVPIGEFSSKSVATFRHPMQCLPQQLTHYLADALCSLPVHVHMVECSRQLEDGTFQVVRSYFCLKLYCIFQFCFLLSGCGHSVLPEAWDRAAHFARVAQLVLWAPRRQGCRNFEFFPHASHILQIKEKFKIVMEAKLTYTIANSLGVARQTSVVEDKAMWAIVLNNIPQYFHPH